VVVVPDGSDEGEESLQDAYEDAVRTVSAVSSRLSFTPVE
jgi:hypothetical protein